MYVDVAFDNSAFSNLLVDVTMVQSFVACAKQEDVRVTISLNVLGECFSQRNPGALEKRATAFRTMIRALGDRLAFCPGGTELVMDYESAAPVRLTATPTLPEYQQVHLHDHFLSARFMQQHAPLVEGLRSAMAKDVALEIDKNAATRGVELLGDDFTPQNVDELVRNLREITLAQDSHFLHLLAENEDHRERVRMTPESYPAIVTLAAYSMLNAAGALASRLGFGSIQQPLCGPRRGEWKDAVTAAAASYARCLITDDQKMLQKFNYIGAELGLRCEAIKLADWLRRGGAT